MYFRAIWELNWKLLQGKHYLVKTGYLRSVQDRRPVSCFGTPLPWITYPAIHLLDLRLNKKMKVLEFGAGNSTLYFAQKCHSVVSIEHNKKWFDELRLRVPANVNLVLVGDSPDDYLSVLHKYGKYFEIILVDGLHRQRSLIECLSVLSDEGVIILDNSDRPDYADACNQLLARGFKELPLAGLVPGSFKWDRTPLTTFFYRANNILQI